MDGSIKVVCERQVGQVHIVRVGVEVGLDKTSVHREVQVLIYTHHLTLIQMYILDFFYIAFTFLM